MDKLVGSMNISEQNSVKSGRKYPLLRPRFAGIWKEMLLPPLIFPAQVLGGGCSGVLVTLLCTPNPAMGLSTRSLCWLALV